MRTNIDIDEIVERWYLNMKHLLPEGLEDRIKGNVKNVMSRLISGDENVAEIVSSIDEEFIEEFVRRSKNPIIFLEGLETLIQVIKRADESLYTSTASSLLQFETKILKKIIQTYSRVLQSEINEKERVSRALKVLSMVNEAILKISDENHLLKEVCRILVEEGKYAYAWVGYAESDMSVIPAAYYRDDEYIKSIKITWEDSKTGIGPIGTAIKTGISQISRDISSDEKYAPWRKSAPKHVFKSSIALPLRYGGEIYGVLNVYAYESHAFGIEEVDLLNHLASNISYAIAKLRMDSKRKELDRLYRTLIESTGTAVFIIDRNGRIKYANNHAEKLTGMNAEILSGKVLSSILVPEEWEKLKEILNEVVEKSKKPVRVLKISISRNGERRICLATVAVVDRSALYILSLLDVTELEMAKTQIDENIESFATLVDGIRNPVTVIHGLVDLYVDDTELKSKIFAELDRIISLVGKLEEGWVHSENIRKFLKNSGD